MLSHSRLNPAPKKRLPWWGWFPLFLVLYEVSVYTANDMIQPAMPRVVADYGVGPGWIATALTAFMLGGGIFTWLLGPYSDRVGRRPVLLGGVALFVLACVSTYLVTRIEGFMLLRVLQGMGMSFIGAVGYAAIQEGFEENRAIRVMALMANVSLLAPLLGPLLGAWIISFAPWQSIFALNAALALIALVGLYLTMPETLSPAAKEAALQSAPTLKRFLPHLGQQYLLLAKDKAFWRNSLTPALMIAPTLGWIGLGPLILMEDFHLTSRDFALWQIPVFSALIGANLFLAYVTGRWPIQRSLYIGLVIAFCAPVFSLIAVFTLGPSVWLLALTTALIGVVDGLSMSVYYRFALTGSDAPKGILAAGVSVVFMAVLALAIESYKWIYLHFEMHGYFVFTALLMSLFLILARRTIRANLALREQG
jgi:DHA1 family multidrug/chloramphenicol efflux transport protein-like MFS transporter